MHVLLPHAAPEYKDIELDWTNLYYLVWQSFNQAHKLFKVIWVQDLGLSKDIGIKAVEVM